MPFIRSLASVRYTLLTIFISLDGEIMSPYSCYVKKGLVCVIITAPFSYQPSFYFEYTKANTRSLCDIHSVSTNEYTF